MGFNGRLIMVVFNGNRTSLSREAKKRGVSPNVVRSRWERAGKPKIVTEDIFDKPTKDYHWKVTLLDDGKKYNISELSRMFNAPRTCIRRFLVGKVSTSCNQLKRFSRDKETIIPSLPKYLEPDYLPDIKFGDLAHLNSCPQENTGAGKGEVEDIKINAIRSLANKVITNAIKDYYSAEKTATFRLDQSSAENFLFGKDRHMLDFWLSMLDGEIDIPDKQYFDNNRSCILRRIKSLENIGTDKHSRPLTQAPDRPHRQLSPTWDKDRSKPEEQTTGSGK